MDLKDSLYKYLFKLYKGQGSPRLYRKYLPYLEQAGPNEINQAVDTLVRQGYPMETLEKPVARFIRSISAFLDNRPPLPLPSDHFLTGLMEENRKMKEWMERLTPAYKSLISIKAHQSPEISRLQKEILRCLKSLQSMELHYQKMQYIVFPRMEEFLPEHRCVQLLWHLQDKALKYLKQLMSELSAPGTLNATEFNRKYGEMFFTLMSLIYREEKIIYPLLFEHLDAHIFHQMLLESGETGWGFGIELKVEEKSEEKRMAIYDDSKEERQRELQRIISSLNSAEDLPRVKKQIRKDFARLLKELSPDEVIQAEQALIEQGMPVEEVQQLCEIHVAAFEDSLKQTSGPNSGESRIPGHPVATYKAENKALRKEIRRLRNSLRKKGSEEGWRAIDQALQSVARVEIHYQRKENQLFPFLEWVDFTGPSKVMWGKHDEIRELLNEMQECVRDRNGEDCKSLVRELSVKLKRMIFMEEKILFPSALKKLSQSQWASMRKGEAEIGYAWIKPGNLWDPSVLPADLPGQEETQQNNKEIKLSTGRLLPEEIDLMLTHLPVDITYVDAEDKVRYYSQGKERIFPRSQGIIGRSVQNCHPPKSVHVVEQIIQDFKDRKRDQAEFWLQLEGQFIHIRYFPLFSGETYKGVLEVSQNISPLRALEGEKRLLD